MSDRLELEWCCLSAQGKRKPINQDTWVHFACNPQGAVALPAAGTWKLTAHDLIFAISDGMGGGNAGELASQILLHDLERHIRETFQAAASGLFPDHLNYLKSTLAHLHVSLNEAASKDAACHGMAATLALAWFSPENIYLANAGDSRIYQFRNDQLTQLSIDHTFAWAEWKRGTISEIEYRNHPRRAALYQVMGGGHAMLHPHFAAVPYQARDRFLICSDGLVDGVWEKHLCEALHSKNSSLSEIAANLLARALEASGIDDTSLMLIEVRCIGS